MATTTDTRRRLGRLQWTTLGIALVTVVAGVGVTIALVRHYRDAPQLRCACGLAWAGADADLVTYSQADADEQQTVPATGSQQAFLVEIVNDSSVTQTILGLSGRDPTAYRPTLEAALENGSQGMSGVRYSADPLAVPPHGHAALRFGFRSVCVAPGDTLLWDRLALRVRVGAFTRTESIALGNSAMAVRGTSSSAACH